MSGQSFPPTFLTDSPQEAELPLGRQQRIDTPHPLRSAGKRSLQQLPVALAAGSDRPAVNPPIAGEQASERDEQLAWADSLLRLHAADLISQLQHWGAEVDARESQLNARDALADLRERQFRHWQKSQQQQIEESKRRAESEEQALRATLRRAAAAAAV
ncbi:hypothetical protein SH139x_003405 [Planctomycetaceae bacterium SH139]